MFPSNWTDWVREARSGADKHTEGSREKSGVMEGRKRGGGGDIKNGREHFESNHENCFSSYVKLKAPNKIPSPNE